MRSSSTASNTAPVRAAMNPIMAMATAASVAAFIFVAVAVGFLGGTL